MTAGEIKRINELYDAHKKVAVKGPRMATEFDFAILEAYRTNKSLTKLSQQFDKNISFINTALRVAALAKVMG